jgi:hypothetical protein
MKDFFVSFNITDRAWADWIAWTLEEAGYEVAYQPWDFRPGGNFVLEMQRAASETRKTVVVLSDNYLRAEYTQPEWAAAFVQDPRGEDRKLIPLRVAPCSPTGLLKPLIFADLVGLTQEEAKQNVLTAVADDRPKPKQAPAFPGAAPAQAHTSPAPAYPGGRPAQATPAPGGGSPQNRVLALWKEKLTFLEEQEAIAVDPAQKSALKKQIEEARGKIREHVEPLLPTAQHHPEGTELKWWLWLAAVGILLAAGWVAYQLYHKAAPKSQPPLSFQCGIIWDIKTSQTLEGVEVSLPEFDLGPKTTNRQGQYCFEVPAPPSKQVKLLATLKDYKALSEKPSLTETRRYNSWPLERIDRP